jgi:hypothetical protein
MAFLDSSGDIILDAVLTDTGRMRLAKGDGSFKITKFAFGDDEINYAKYDKDHASGSAYYDLQILQTPVLEAFTNNTSMLKNKLLSIPRTNLLYLPILKLNEAGSKHDRNKSANQALDKFVVAVDEDTATDATATNTPPGPGIMQIKGNDSPKTTLNNAGIINGTDSDPDGAFIRIDQGLDTEELSPQFPISPDLMETQWIIEMDNRLGTIASAGRYNMGEPDQPAPVSFIDDDNIASYFLSLNTNPNFIKNISSWSKKHTDVSQLKGPRGTSIRFKILSSIELRTSTFLFDRIGQTSQTWTFPAAIDSGGTLTVHYIDSIVRVTGATTGYSLDIPVRFVKKA